MKSIAQKLMKMEGLLNTTHLNDWENKFLSKWVPLGLARAKAGHPTNFTDPVQDKIDEVYEKHFGN